MIGGSKKFNMHAQFSGSCKSCEYRQLIRGYVRYKQPGGAWYFDNKPLAPNVFLDMNTFQEDGYREGSPGHYKYFRAGHRNDAPASDSSSPTGFFYFPSDQYSPTRASGCNYDSTDQPSALAPKTAAVDFQAHFEFKGQIVQVDANGNQVGDPLREVTWTVDLP
jgi:hypothetical protein